MKFTWDGRKRQSNLRKHGIGVVVSVAHTERGDEIRIISMRKATRNETHFYFSQFAD